MVIRALTEGFADWPAGQDALIDALECVILAGWEPRDSDPAEDIDDEDVAELYRVFHRLTGWVPTVDEKAAARPLG